jgi:hypothetical protein
MSKGQGGKKTSEKDTMIRTQFAPSVIERIGYYVYLLIDPSINKVFYVGKGAGNRIFAHLHAALADETPSDKLDRIRAIQESGLEVQHVLLRHGLTEKEAFEIEAALIDFIGLDDLTNLVQGYATDDRGRMTVREAIAKHNAPLADISEPVILITVNRLYRYGMSAADLYDITRGNWVIGVRRNRARYAFAVYQGVIREVYEIERWLPADARSEKQKTKKRWYFDGKIAENLRHYVGQSTAKYAVLGAQNPIRYVNC